MKENLILVNYKVESEAYQALSELKRDTSNANYTLSQAAIVKKENGTLNIMDGFVNGGTTGDDTWKGRLIGSLVGILGGPLGVLFGGSVGSLIGDSMDVKEMEGKSALLERAGGCLTDGETALLLLMQEADETALGAKLKDFQVSITRMDAAEIATEIEQAEEQARLKEEETAALPEAKEE